MTWRRRLARRLRRLARLIEGKPTVNMLEEAGLRPRTVSLTFDDAGDTISLYLNGSLFSTKPLGGCTFKNCTF